MLISIIVPLFNKKNSISRTLSSLLSQDSNNYEVIIIDDGSTDGSDEIAKEYVYKYPLKFRYIYKKNQGVSSARNAGLSYAIGTWIMFFDADDIALPNMLALFERLIVKYSSYKVITANYKSSNPAYGKNERLYKKPSFKYFWYRTFNLRMGTVVFHKSIFDNEKLLFNSELSFYEDLDFSLRILDLYDIVYVPDEVMVYNTADNGLSRGYHPLNKDFASNIDMNNITLRKLYKSLILYGNIYASYKYRRSINDFYGCSYYSNKMERKKYFLTIYYIFRIPLKIRMTIFKYFKCKV